MKWLKFSIFTLVIAGLFTAAYPARYTIRFVGSSDSNSPFMQGAQEFARMVKKDTQGDVDVQVFPKSQVGDKKYTQISMVKAVTDGEIEMAMSAAAVLSNYYPKIGVLDLPYLFRDYKQYDAVLEGSIGQELLKGLIPNKIRGLGYFDVTIRGIVTVNKQIRRPDDLRGLRLRTMESPLYISLFKRWGADPVPTTIREVVNSAKKGYLQGTDQSYPPFWDFGQYQVFKVFNETNHAMVAVPFYINEAYYESLPKAYQDILNKAAIQAARFQRNLARKHADEIRELCKKEGITIVKLTPAQREVFEKSAQPVYEQFAYQFGDLVQRIKNVR